VAGSLVRRVHHPSLFCSGEDFPVYLCHPERAQQSKDPY
jgi:hypothetical protein